MLTSLASLLQTLTKSSTVTEKWLMTNIRATREAYNRGEITNIDCLRFKYNIADVLAKITQCYAFANVALNGTLDMNIKEWIELETPLPTSIIMETLSVNIWNADEENRTHYAGRYTTFCRP